jgi:hypothetical protein
MDRLPHGVFSILSWFLLVDCLNEPSLTVKPLREEGQVELLGETPNGLIAGARMLPGERQCQSYFQRMKKNVYYYKRENNGHNLFPKPQHTDFLSHRFQVNVLLDDVTVAQIYNVVWPKCRTPSARSLYAIGNR